MTQPTPVIVALIFIAGAGAGAGAVLACADAPTVRAHTLLNLTTDELRWAKTNVRVNLNSYKADSETGPHRHPGPTLIYLLEGELEDTTAAGTRTLKTGDVTWDRGRAEHNLRNRTPRAVRALAVHLEPGR